MKAFSRQHLFCFLSRIIIVAVIFGPYFFCLVMVADGGAKLTNELGTELGVVKTIERT